MHLDFYAGRMRKAQRHVSVEGFGQNPHLNTGFGLSLIIKLDRQIQEHDQLLVAPKQRE